MVHFVKIPYLCEETSERFGGSINCLKMPLMGNFTRCDRFSLRKVDSIKKQNGFQGLDILSVHIPLCDDLAIDSLICTKGEDVEFGDGNFIMWGLMSRGDKGHR